MRPLLLLLTLSPSAWAQTTWLGAGTGDGFAQFPVGPFGEISAVGGAVGTWDPPGAEPSTGTTYNTFLVVSDRATSPGSPVGHTLYQPYEFATYNRLGDQPAGLVNLVEVSGGPDTRVTTFDLPAFPGLSVHLTQVVVGSTLTQTYLFSNSGPTATLTLSRFSDIDLEVGGGGFTQNWGRYDAASPLEVVVEDLSQSWLGVSSLGGDVVAEGARVYMRTAGAGGGNHDRVPVSFNLGHPSGRLIFEACDYGGDPAYGDCGYVIDADADGVTDMIGDLGPTVQGTLVVPSGGQATAIVGLAYTCGDDDLDGVCDALDNCPAQANPGQEDFTGDGVGDACEPAIYLSFAGACPGPVTASMAHLTPGGIVAVVRSAAPGSMLIPAGICAGTPIALAPPATLITTLVVPPGGVLNRTFLLGAPSCGAWVALVDMSTCRTSSAQMVP